MPYVQCPVCEETVHLRVQGDVGEWLEKHAPQRSEDGAPLMVCSRCWEEMREEGRTTLRIAPDGMQGALPLGVEGTLVSATDETRVIAFGDARIVLDNAGISIAT